VSDVEELSSFHPNSLCYLNLTSEGSWEHCKRCGRGHNLSVWLFLKQHGYKCVSLPFLVNQQYIDAGGGHVGSSGRIFIYFFFVGHLTMLPGTHTIHCQTVG
jgi:hypothetical protein